MPGVRAVDDVCAGRSQAGLRKEGGMINAIAVAGLSVFMLVVLLLINVLVGLMVGKILRSLCK